MKKFTALAAIFGLMLIMTSCSKPGEVVVTKYFQAMAHNDMDTMSSMAVTPKNLDYESYKIKSVSEPEIVDFQLPAMMEQMEVLKQERQELLNTVRDMQDEVDELEFEMNETRRRSRKAELQQQIEEKQAAMEAETTKFRQLVAAMGKLKNDIEFEQEIVKLSTGVRQSPEIYTGKTTKIPVTTHVVFKDGSEEDYVFELVKYELNVEERVLPNRLIILNILTQAEYDKMKAGEPVDEAAPAEDVAMEDVTEEDPAFVEDEPVDEQE
ncbi:MAG TPA: hypothetical protein ENN40_06310 [Candidatus Aminicenantes bacterium]|nr:hypothetical protein [Candidatus Aminicenantes bacterium]